MIPREISEQLYFDSRMNCIDNAYNNTLILREYGYNPSIWFVSTPIGNHAYLEIEGLIYNSGVTWGTDRYPNLSYEEILQLSYDGNAVEITNELDEAYRGDRLYKVFGGECCLARMQIDNEKFL
jgi:hypothetical protein